MRASVLRLALTPWSYLMSGINAETLNRRQMVANLAQLLQVGSLHGLERFASRGRGHRRRVGRGRRSEALSDGYQLSSVR